MKPANESPSICKRIVQEGYDQCAGRYQEARQETVPLEIGELDNRLAVPSTILDLGCGSGIPITKWLARKHVVTGVDFSEAQINLAMANVPSAKFICKDMMEVSFQPSSFEAIVSLYAIFHLPRKEQIILFRRISQWLSPGGYLLASLSYTDQPSYTEENFFGVEMYWDSLSIDEYEKQLQGAGLKRIAVTETGHGYSLSSKKESHPIVLARKGTGA